MGKKMSVAENTVVVILAAGKGTRMGRSDFGKVCFEIDSVPAINRAIATFKGEGLRRFLLVVGTQSEQVIETVHQQHPGVLVVYQAPQLGTGHAARVAAEALENLGYEGAVLVTMGDKYIEPLAVQELISGFVKQRADMALLTIPKSGTGSDSSGRVFLDDAGQVLDIIEKADLARQAVVDKLRDSLKKKARITAKAVRDLIASRIPNPAKQAVAVGELLKLAKGDGQVDRQCLTEALKGPKYNLSVEGECYTEREMERLCHGVNPSLYLFRSEAFYEGVKLIDNNNAQGEFYLTDSVRHLGALVGRQGERKYRIRSVNVDDPTVIQGFNSPDDLLAIQDHVRRKKAAPSASKAVSRVRLSPRQYRTVTQWLEALEGDGKAVDRWCRKIYGHHDGVVVPKAKAIRDVLRCYGKRFGFDGKVCIVRAPGRINLMGRHVDHRGGFNNFLALDRETLAVVGARSDTRVVAVNTQPAKYPAFEFSISDLISRFAWSDWLNVVNSDWVQNMLAMSAGDWSNYVKAAVLRLQHEYQDVRLPGINMAVSGNIPVAAGLSSSSSLVVGTLQALIALNQFELTSQQFIDLCGEGEWFVGSRGGAGDHAAIYLGQRGKIAQVGYLPFRVERIMEAPRDYRVVVADSHIKSAKSAASKSTFNSKIASYNLGLALLQQRSPELAGVLEYVRDLHPEKLGCTTSGIYRLLLRVPQRMTRKDLRAVLSAEHRDLMETNFATHSEPPFYSLRGVLMFGAAEIARSRICVDYLESGRIDEFGALMKVSHDGDRVSRAGPDGRSLPVEDGCTDDCLNRLIADLGSEDPDRVLRAQLYMQPGYYGCSMPGIDRMVDIACSVQGVAGAQIAGAGLGGCIMILVKEESVSAVRRALARHYYRPEGLKPDVMPCHAAEGAGLVEF